jgi:hypothetical protein
MVPLLYYLPVFIVLEVHAFMRPEDLRVPSLARFAPLQARRFYLRLLHTLAAFVAVLAVAAFAAPASAFPEFSIAEQKTMPPVDPSADIASWSGAASVQLTWEVQRGRAMTEPTTARIATDAQFVYVRFDVMQREKVVQTQRTNDVGLGTDDEVWVDLWPNGASGYAYQFIATPNGTHYESSTENANYAPHWQSFGAATPTGYTVTMKIPLDVMRGARSSRTWKVQFVRFIRETGQQAVWSYDSAQTSPDDLARAGSMQMTVSSARRPLPRLATYVIGSLSPRGAGGSSSRMGADLSVPVNESTSFYATLHPDFSNVELDQQTISPSVFQRQFAEVRPFFTQGSANFNNYYCNFCNGLAPLYTPSIPTPRDGYAVEGKEGPVGFTAFDSVGLQRNDQATSLLFVSPDTRWNATILRSASDTPAIKDDEIFGDIFYNDLKHVTVYANYGSDAGTRVLRSDQAQMYDAGATWTDQTFSAWGGIHKFGDYFNPVDALVSHPGIAGWGLYSNKIWDFSKTDALAAVSIGGAISRDHGDSGALNQAASKLEIDALTQNSIDVLLTTGSSYVALDNGALTPISQYGAAITYHSGSQTNNPISFDTHGPSATPTTVSFNTGRYGAGRLDTWVRSSTMRLGQRGTLTLDVDDTAQRFAAGPGNTQWFERLAYTMQSGRESSFGIGIRRIVGDPPIPNGGGGCAGVCSNISLAYHVRLPHSEFYVAYGDPNTLSTAPQVLLKMIIYTGADKGT